MTSSIPAVAAPTAARSRVAAGPAAVAVVAAVAVAVAVRLAAGALGVDVRVSMGGSTTPVTLGAVVTASAVAALLGWALLAVLTRWISRPVTAWRTVAVLVLLLSLGGPLSSGVDAASIAVLVALHAAVAAALVTLLPRAVRSR
jgi:hypothetical protein